MPDEVKRQHYVPQFYLNWFTTTEEGSRKATFWVYDKKGGEPRRQTPINTAVESRFYDLEHQGVRVPVEEMLAAIESAAKPVLERLAQGEPPRPADIPLLSRFLAYMHSRVPHNIAMTEEAGTVLAHEMLKASADDSNDEIAATIEGAGLKGVTVQEVREWYRNAETYIPKLNHLPDGYWLASSLRQAPVVDAILLRMQWTTCTTPEGSSFVTGDTPLCPLTWWGDGIAGFGGGFAQPTTEVTFPLSPKACLFITHWRKRPWLPMTGRWVKDINRRTAHIAERYIITPYRSADTDALVGESRETCGLPKVDRTVIGALFRSEKGRRSRG
jgi:hypothetical protein